MMKGTNRPQEEAHVDVATLRLDMIRLIEVPAPHENNHQDEQPSAFVSASSSKSLAGAGTSPPVANQSGVASTAGPGLKVPFSMGTRTESFVRNDVPKKRIKNDKPTSSTSVAPRHKRILYWPCLLFRNQRQMMDIWDKYQDLYFGPSIARNNNNHQLLSARDQEDADAAERREKRHIKDAMEYEYALHMLEASSSNLMYNPNDDMVALLLGPQDEAGTPFRMNARSIPRTLYASQYSPHSGLPLHFFHLPLTCWLRSWENHTMPKQQPPQSSLDLGSKGVQDTVRQIQQLYQHVLTGQAQNPIVTNSQQQQATLSSVRSAPLSAVAQPLLSSNHSKQPAETDAVPWYLRTPSDDEDDDDDDKVKLEDNPQILRTTISNAAVPAAATTTPCHGLSDTTPHMTDYKSPRPPSTSLTRIEDAIPNKVQSEPTVNTPVNPVTPSTVSSMGGVETPGSSTRNPITPFSCRSGVLDQPCSSTLESCPQVALQEFKQTQRKLSFGEESQDDDKEVVKPETKKRKIYGDDTTSMMETRSDSKTKARKKEVWDDSSDEGDEMDQVPYALPAKDQALQRILKRDAGFEFQLLPHQFEAVRRVAGVPEEFPLHSASRVHDPRQARLSSAVAGLYRPENVPDTRGLCIADAMGLYVYEKSL